MSTFVALLWVAFAGWLVTTSTPPARVAALRSSSAPGSLPTTVGHALRRRVGLPPDTDAARTLGRGLTAAVVSAAIDPVLGLGVGAMAAFATCYRRQSTVRRAAVQRVEAMPALVDLLRLATATGRTLPLALPVAARWSAPVLQPDLAQATRALERGQPMERVLGDLAELWGPAGAPVIAGLVDHARYGTPLAPALDRITDESRRIRRHAGEARIRRLPVTLLFPLVLCTLPAFGLLSVGPMIAGSLQSLLDGGLEAPASPPTDVPDIGPHLLEGTPCIAFSPSSNSSPCP